MWLALAWQPILTSSSALESLTPVCHIFPSCMRPCERLRRARNGPETATSSIVIRHHARLDMTARDGKTVYEAKLTVTFPGHS
ncbi:hypothetical protein EV356DRAFT_151360 [Viridothelium virens]|uniref:Uncharacterized protein n=1 Tax=Viridothelium virens TaxID=1048519 RepID=A0A6A6H9A6_VIRVR|nr:hypothetical protein EV356DRAFT_151360 [Viridothelium virens]